MIYIFTTISFRWQTRYYVSANEPWKLDLKWFQIKVKNIVSNNKTLFLFFFFEHTPYISQISYRMWPLLPRQTKGDVIDRDQSV